MLLLSPLSERQILAGKAIGNGVIAALPSLTSLVLSYALFPAGSVALWLSIPVGALATYTLAAPAAAALSAVFPRAVDLNSIGQKSNAHGLAGLLGMASFVLAAIPPVLLTVISTRLLARPDITPLLLLVWCAIAIAAARLLLHPVASLLRRRRENLALIGVRT
jgi:hypothetical protein